MNKRVQQGFTLIELMIVVAIIGILAAVAIPQYKDYTAKAKASSLISSIDSTKTAVGICAQTLGTLTGCNSGENDVPTFNATKEVASATVANGVITLVAASGFADGVSGKSIVVTPSFEAGKSTMTWTVDASAITTNDAVKTYLQKNNP